MFFFCFLSIRRPPRTPRPITRFAYTTLFRASEVSTGRRSDWRTCGAGRRGRGEASGWVGYQLLRYDQVAIPHEERRMLLARVLFIKMRHEPYLADPVLGAYRRGGVEIVVDHEPLPAAVLAFDGAPDAHMAEPGIALFRVRLPGPEAQPDQIGRAHV